LPGQIFDGQAGLHYNESNADRLGLFITSVDATCAIDPNFCAEIFGQIAKNAAAISVTVRIPSGVGQVIRPDGSIVPAGWAVVIPSWRPYGISDRTVRDTPQMRIEVRFPTEALADADVRTYDPEVDDIRSLLDDVVIASERKVNSSFRDLGKIHGQPT
jgi:hypothetical protein